MKKILFICYVLLFNSLMAFSQACTPLGDEITYGTNDVWLGYIYDNQNFTNYAGFVTEGVASNPNFDETFTGDYVNYNTNGCPIFTETFSARYKLNKTFAAGTYDITVGGDDGFRLSIDGGATWIINQWWDHAYYTSSATITLNGNYNLVLEFYENGGGNRVSFAVSPTCGASDNTSIYGTNNQWIGYLYDDMNFDPLKYKGYVTEGNIGSPNFDESFGGDYVTYNTSSCPVYTETFSARYRLTKNFANGIYNFVVGGDDGYRFSIDGGATWIINEWFDHSYTSTTAASLTLNGTYDLVLEFYENSAQNRVTFTTFGNVLPIKLIDFTAKKINQLSAKLSWAMQNEEDIAIYEIQKSTDNINFNTFEVVKPQNGKYIITDDKITANTYYYRLKIITKSNQIIYYNVVSLEFNIDKKLKIFPSIVTNNTINIYTNNTLINEKLTLLDPLGKLVAQIDLPKIINAGTTLSLKLSNQKIAVGNYFICFTNNNAEITTQLINIL
jgi:hypothetical protein